MKGKQLAILCAAAVVLTLLAIMTTRTNAPSSPSSMGKKVFPDLEVNDVTRIEIRAAGKSISIAKVEHEWVVTNRFNYPADYSRVSRTVLKLADLKFGQVMTLDESQKKSLKMISPPEDGSPADTSTTGSQIDLYAGTKQLASLLAGETHTRKAQGQASQFGSYPDGQYISTDSGKTVYLVGETLSSLFSTIREWLDSNILNVPSDDIIEVVIDTSGAKPIKLVKSDSGSLVVAKLSRRKTTDESKAMAIASALSYLRCHDIADPSMTDKDLGMDDPSTFTATIKDGTIYTLTLGADREGTDDKYVRVSATWKAPSQDGDEETEDTDADADEQDPEEDVRQLNERLAKWTFIIESYATDPMLTTKDELIKKKEKKPKK